MDAVLWKRTHRSISAILYEEDPEFMGSTVGSPDDEYDDVAIGMMRKFRDRAPGQSVAEVVRNEWPDASRKLVEGLERMWTLAEHEQVNPPDLTPEDRDMVREVVRTSAPARLGDLERLFATGEVGRTSLDQIVEVLLLEAVGDSWGEGPRGRRLEGLIDRLLRYFDTAWDDEVDDEGSTT